jgi:hypothetical protein
MISILRSTLPLLHVDNHTCILLRIKNTLGIQRKVTAVLRLLQAWIRGQLVVYRTDTEQEVRNRRLSLLPIFYNSCQQLCLQLQYTTLTYYYYYYYWLPQKIHLPRLLLLSPLPRLSSNSEPRTSRSIVPRIVKLLILYKNASFLQPHLRCIIVNEPRIIVLKS